MVTGADQTDGRGRPATSGLDKTTFLIEGAGGAGRERTRTGRALRELDDITATIIDAAIQLGRNTLLDGLRRVVDDLPPAASPRGSA
jgi:hypothetical protein